jgi:hypothetical protein
MMMTSSVAAAVAAAVAAVVNPGLVISMRPAAVLLEPRPRV